MRSAYQSSGAGELEAGVAEFRQILEAHPDNRRIHNDLGSVLLRLGRPARVPEHF